MNCTRVQFDRAIGLGLAFTTLAVLPARAAKPFPPPPTSYVYNEGVVSPSTQGELSSALRHFEERTGHQFVVALFQSLEGESVDDYSNRLFRTWKIGDIKKNDGLLLCLFLQERRWRIEVGYGLEGTLTDLEAAEIARQSGVPSFKEGNFDQGVRATVLALIAKLGGDTAAPESRPGMNRPRPARAPPSNEGLKALWYFLFAFYIFFWITYDRGFHWGMDDWTLGRRCSNEPRYPLRVFFILLVYVLFLVRHGFDLMRLAGSSGSSGGGFSGGGGSSGGGGASGSW